jgi:ABC-type antimicrobial peptide transport system permease subunit
MKQRLEGDPRISVEAQRETRFYAEQSEQLATFLAILGVVLSSVFSLGAMIGALITLYGAVASRTREIGTLRALGFEPRSILTAFLLESLLVGMAGGVIGLGFAAGLQFITISTMNWQSFSELAFSFVLTPRIALQALLIAVLMGLLGGLLPALKAARMNVIEALRSA